MARQVLLRKRKSREVGFNQPLQFGKKDPTQSTDKNPSRSWWADTPRDRWQQAVAAETPRMLSSRFNDIENTSYSPHRFSEIRSKDNDKRRTYGRDLVESVTGAERSEL